MTDLTDEIIAALRAPWDPPALHWVVSATKKGSNGKVESEGWVPYVDAIQIQERLDAVVGPGNWSSTIEQVAGSTPPAVLMALTVCGVTKSDAGEAGKQADQPIKAATSDALKRAAVHFGIGRYLRDMKMVWLPYRQGPPKPGTAPAARTGAPTRPSTTPAPATPPAPAAAPPGKQPPADPPPAPSERNGSTPSFQADLVAKSKALTAVKICDILDVNIYDGASKGDASVALNHHIRVTAAARATDLEGACKIIMDRITKWERERENANQYQQGNPTSTTPSR